MTTPAAIAQYDVLWKGAAHRNFCVPFVNGKATIKVDGLPEFQLYFARIDAKSSKTASLFAEGLETPGTIAIDTPDDPHANGHLCLGIAM